MSIPLNNVLRKRPAVQSYRSMLGDGLQCPSHHPALLPPSQQGDAVPYPRQIIVPPQVPTAVHPPKGARLSPPLPSDPTKGGRFGTRCPVVAQRSEFYRVLRPSTVAPCSHPTYRQRLWICRVVRIPRYVGRWGSLRASSFSPADIASLLPQVRSPAGHVRLSGIQVPWSCAGTRDLSEARMVSCLQLASPSLRSVYLLFRVASIIELMISTALVCGRGRCWVLSTLLCDRPLFNHCRLQIQCENRCLGLHCGWSWLPAAQQRRSEFFLPSTCVLCCKLSLMEYSAS